jgi:hydrogenase maturation protease
MNELDWQLLEEKTPVESVSIQGIEIKPGERVRLRPRAGGDIFDLALAGRTAIVESIEQDYEGKLHLAVIVDDDPGRDLGMMRQPGHRFFFAPEEVEPVASESVSPSDGENKL